MIYKLSATPIKTSGDFCRLYIHGKEREIEEPRQILKKKKKLDVSNYLVSRLTIKL